jgi:hypothetical protein
LYKIPDYSLSSIITTIHFGFFSACGFPHGGNWLSMYFKAILETKKIIQAKEKEMKIKRTLTVIAVFLLIVGAVNVEAAGLRASPAQIPWTPQQIWGDSPGVLNLASAFVGNNEVPMMSWGVSGNDIIYRTHKTLDGNGNCGPDDTWRCQSASAADLVDGTLSNLATEVFINSHILRWVFQSGTKLQGLSIEQNDAMAFLTSSSTDLVDLTKFGGVLIGAPSLISDGLRYQMIFTARESGGGDFPLHQVVYLHYTGTLNNSCLDNTRYQCDVIEQAVGPNSLGAPSFQQALDGNLGVAYYKNGTIRYAYPWTTMPFRPANCGPGGNTWRCINIAAPSSGSLGPTVALGLGSSRSAAGILYNYNSPTNDMVMRAVYVGSGGDCGQDGTTVSLTPIYRWQCSAVDSFIEDIDQTTYSIAFDPDDYPVIAYNNQILDDSTQRLYITFPDARIDGGTGWHRYLVDGNQYSITGLHNDISLNTEGLGFIGYIQPKFKACGDIWCVPDLTPNLKAALQFDMITTYLPIIVK